MFNKNVAGGFVQVVIPIALLLLVGGVVMAWTFTKQEKSPDQIVSEAVASLVEAKSFSYEADVRSKGDGTFKGGLRVKGGIDFLKTESPRFAATLSADLVAQGNKVAGELEIRFVDNVLYLKLAGKDLPKSGPAAMVNLFANKWVRLDTEGAGQFLDESQVNGIEDVIENNSKARSIFSKYLKDKKLLVVGQDLGEEIIDGEPVLRYYSVFIDRSVLAQIIPDLYRDLKREGLLGEYDELTEEDISRLEKDIMDSDIPHADIWVNKKDYTLRQVSVAPVIDVPATSEGLVIRFSGYNLPLEVSAPSGAMGIEEIFSAMFSGLNPEMFEMPQGAFPR